MLQPAYAGRRLHKMIKSFARALSRLRPRGNRLAKLLTKLFVSASGRRRTTLHGLKNQNLC